jgi:hypothetical protein
MLLVLLFDEVREETYRLLSAGMGGSVRKKAVFSSVF